MTRTRKTIAASIVVLAIAAACTSDAEPAARRSPGLRFERGGTLRVGMALLPFSTLREEAFALDPQKEYFFDSWALFHCCLLRTLMSYPGRPTEDGGSVLRPDLAAAMPEVSEDGLRWTFRLKEGLRFAPPFQDTEIKAQDIIRALERMGDRKAAPDGSYSFYYSTIQGFDEFRAGKADSISGLEAPDDHTLFVHLDEPAGDLGHRFALPATAPIPAGATKGHVDGYGRFLVASGPYMLEGSEAIDFTVPPREQVPASGMVLGKSITLTRNPSWDPATDELRPAYADRIELTLDAGSPEFEATERALREMSREVDAGRFDLVMHAGPWPQVPLEQVRSFQRDPKLEDQVFVNSRDFVWYISINPAIPPFDDIHVRKALNLVVDKAALLERAGGSLSGRIAGHIVLDSLLNNLLLDYDPYATPGHGGDVAAARAEMARSAYDRDGDGRCDGRSCTGAVALAFEDKLWTEQADIIRDNFKRIGIDLDIRFLESGKVFEILGDPSNKVALGLVIGWGKDFINGSNFFLPLFDSSSIADQFNNNHALLGATPEQLEEWGFDVASVPSIDDKIAECLPLLGNEQVQCWAEADQLLMEEVVPWVPLRFESHVRTVSSRVASYSFDQFVALPALDRIALKQKT